MVLNFDDLIKPIFSTLFGKDGEFKLVLKHAEMLPVHHIVLIAPHKLITITKAPLEIVWLALFQSLIFPGRNKN